jgi:hypothetical protein
MSEMLQALPPWWAVFLVCCLPSHRRGNEPLVWFLLTGATWLILALRTPRKDLSWIAKALSRR